MQCRCVRVDQADQILIRRAQQFEFRQYMYFRVWRILSADKLAEFGTFSGKFHACLYVDIKKWSRNRGIARHKVCMVLPISLLFEQNLPIPTVLLLCENI